LPGICILWAGRNLPAPIHHWRLTNSNYGTILCILYFQGFTDFVIRETLGLWYF